MAGKKREDVREEDITGLKYFDKLAPLLARLHEVDQYKDSRPLYSLLFPRALGLMVHAWRKRR